MRMENITDPFIREIRNYPDNKVDGANMGPTWGRQDPGGPHVGPMNFAIWVSLMRDGLHQTHAP